MSDDILETLVEAAMRDALHGGVGVLLAGKRLPPSEVFRDLEAEVDLVKQAAQQFRNDPRFRMLVDSTVAEAFAQHGRIDHETPERDAHEIATWATALMLARIYEQDAELRAMREERDRYRVLAENTFAVAPTTMIRPTIQKP